MCNKEYINLQTKEMLDLEKVTTLKDNAMLKVKPELWIEWDFKKNHELGFDIWRMTKGNNKKAWWICSKCDNSYDSSINKRTSVNRGCGYCNGSRVTLELSFGYNYKELVEEWDYERNDKSPFEYKPMSNKKVWWKCSTCKSSFGSTIYNRAVGKNCPYCAGVKVNDTNCLSKIRPDLVDFWDKDKNKEFTMEKVTKYSKYLAWWICESCGDSYQRRVYVKIKSSNNCQCCNNRRARKNNSLAYLNVKLANEWNYEKNNGETPYDFVLNSNKKVWWKCELGHEWEAGIDQRVGKGSGCPYCSGRSAWKGESDMWTTNPKLASLLLNPEDGYKHKERSSEILNWKCPECNNIIRKSPNKVHVNGLCCPICNSSSSYAEKIVASLLDKMNIEFIYDRSTEWSNKKRYDFYIPSLNMIIETHGIQHYEEVKFSYNHNPNNQIENDKYKKEMALRNGIEHYIELDCRKSDFEYIKNEILKSELVDILKINKVDISYEDIKELDNKIIKSWDLWNKRYSTGEIAKELQISNATVVRYLKRGNLTGKCNYDESNKGQIQNRKKVVTLNMETFELKIHDRVIDASKYTGLKSITGAGKACKGNMTFKGYKFMYYDDYIKYLEGFKS